MGKVLLALLLASVFLLGGCKPTEKGYKTAYDAALNKRKAALEDMNLQMQTSELQEIDGMQLKEVDGVKVFLMRQNLKPVEEATEIPGVYNVAVGMYKMSTNCLAQVKDLREERLQAFAAQDSEGMYYTIAGSFGDLKQAVKFEQEYQKKRDRTYVGLHNAPVIIFSPK